uniref:RNase H type-1 domain-containing protein n=1 Tax=Rhizophora mucronata TaxID=61149 RepID=A0A2P2J5S8_RHIMU
MIARGRDKIDSLDSVLAQQFSEIADDETLDFDVDYAFNLQMQEAISASLTLHPSPLGNEVVPGDEVDYLGFLLEDIVRLERERLDFEPTDDLLREIKEDLDRRIHDQNFAREILNIPDDQWQKYGDNYHRPYGTTGASSSSSSSSYSTEVSNFAMLNSETFKLYCKGVMSDERVKDRNVVVGGVGVAICDSRDNLIFEVSKASEVGVGEGIVEIGALIEGLNSALCLDLKKVTFFCDDYMIYQYVSC